MRLAALTSIFALASTGGLHAGIFDSPILLNTRTAIVDDGLFSPSVVGRVTTDDDEHVESLFRFDVDFDGAFEGTIDTLAESTEGLIRNVRVNGIIDPFHIGAATFVDPGSPSSFFLTLTTPITPLTGKWRFDARGTVLASNNAGASESYAPALSSGFFFEHSIEGMIVASQGGSLLSEADAPSTFITTGTFDCGVGACSPLVSSFGFTGSGGGDSYAMSLSLTVSEIPVPLPGIMLGSGLLAMLGMNRLRRS